MNARAYLHVYVKRGRVKKGLCRFCAIRIQRPVEGHHSDYSKPLMVTWLCKEHHQEVTNRQRLAYVPQPVVWPIQSTP